MTIHQKKLLLIDAHAIIHRAFHALPPLSLPTGQPIHAVYGYLLILFRALKDLKPDYVAVAFDTKGETHRHKKFKAYKANRPPTPDELLSQFPIVQEVTRVFGFPTYAISGYEADDIIGTISHKLQKHDIEIIIVTGDLDLLQLVNHHTKVLKLHKGIKETQLFDEKIVAEVYGFTPTQVIEYKGLRGDASDNIPGVKGIGEKGAVKLLKHYSTIESIYKHLEALSPREQCVLADQKNQATLSRELATIDRNVPLTFVLDDAKIGMYHRDAIIDVLRKYEFKSLLAQVSKLPGMDRQSELFANTSEVSTASSSKEKETFQYHLIKSVEEIDSLAEKLQHQSMFAFDTETSALNPFIAELVGISFSWNAGEGYFLACGKHVPHRIARILEDACIRKTGHNTKFDIEVLHHAGVDVQGVVFDTMLASYLFNAGLRGHSLDHLAFVEFGHEMQPIEELIGKGKTQQSMNKVDVEKVSWYACEDADFSWRLYEHFAPLLQKEKLQKLFDDIEMPTVEALVAMEECGVKIDVNFLQDMSQRLHHRITQLEKKIHEVGGVKFNIASPIQLKDVLFKILHISTSNIRRTKTGFSTQASELEKLRGTHPIIDLISEYRELTKLTSTYIDTLPSLILPTTGRIHTSFNQTIAATGRLSSSDPNLQNIPVRTELGREIRNAFIPDRGFRIVSCDYSQVELRIVAHLADDSVMKEAFRKGEDIHVRTAAELHDVTIDRVTSEMRRRAKAINFGILYGMGVSGIMRDSGSSREEAQAFLEKYFSIHKGIHRYLEDVKTFARKHHYTETMFGRRRALPDITSHNRMLAAAAERAGVNMPIQGTAADLMKIAMIAVHRAIMQQHIKARMMLQVHDELVFEIQTDILDHEAQKIKNIMENAYTISVPLEVNVEIGMNWGELKPLTFLS